MPDARRMLVVAPPAGPAGAPLVAAIRHAVSLALAGDVADEDERFVHVVACIHDPGLDVGDDALRESLLADASSWLQASVGDVDARGVDVTWECAWAPHAAAWVAGTAREGGFAAVVLPCTGDDRGGFAGELERELGSDVPLVRVFPAPPEG